MTTKTPVTMSEALIRTLVVAAVELGMPLSCPPGSLVHERATCPDATKRHNFQVKSSTTPGVTKELVESGLSLEEIDGVAEMVDGMLRVFWNLQGTHGIGVEEFKKNVETAYLAFANGFPWIKSRGAKSVADRIMVLVSRTVDGFGYSPGARRWSEAMPTYLSLDVPGPGERDAIVRAIGFLVAFPQATSILSALVANVTMTSRRQLRDFVYMGETLGEFARIDPLLQVASPGLETIFERDETWTNRDAYDLARSEVLATLERVVRA